MAQRVPAAGVAGAAGSRRGRPRCIAAHLRERRGAEGRTQPVAARRTCRPT
jgi:hypothetical protein